MKRRHFIQLVSLSFILKICAYTTPAVAARKRIVVIGDSLAAGYKLPKKDGFVPQLESAMYDLGHRINFINGSVSGDTASGGLSRLNKTLGKRVSAVILELGANDALRGIDPNVTYEALHTILTILEVRKIPVLLAGMRAPRNMGAQYISRFDAIYTKLAEEFNVILYPFFLKDVAFQYHLNLPDRIHPNAQGIKVIVKNITPYVEQLIKRIP